MQINPNRIAHSAELMESIAALKDNITTIESLSKVNRDNLNLLNANSPEDSAILERIATLRRALSYAELISNINSDLVNSVKQIAALLDWYDKKVPCEETHDLQYSNANIIGQRGIILHDSLTVGLTVMPANTMYPKHRHVEEEFYVVLSPGRWNQERGPWVHKQLGDYVYNPSNIVHATKTETCPLVTIWFHYAPRKRDKIQHGISSILEIINSGFDQGKRQVKTQIRSQGGE